MSSGEPDADLFHLAAIAELKLGRRHGAAGFLHRAAAINDTAMMFLAREEMKFLTCDSPGTSS